jgi:hypothetical protein
LNLSLQLPALLPHHLPALNLPDISPVDQGGEPGQEGGQAVRSRAGSDQRVMTESGVMPNTNPNTNQYTPKQRGNTKYLLTFRHHLYGISASTISPLLTLPFIEGKVVWEAHPCSNLHKEWRLVSTVSHRCRDLACASIFFRTLPSGGCPSEIIRENQNNSEKFKKIQENSNNSRKFKKFKINSRKIEKIQENQNNSRKLRKIKTIQLN